MEENNKIDYFYQDHDRFRVQAILLSKVVERILKKKADIILSSPAEHKLKSIIPFMKRMRVSGLEKFGDKTFIAVINYYRNNDDLNNNKAAGALILYVPRTYIVKLIRAMDYIVEDEEDTNMLLDACGTFCNLVAGNFKNGLSQLGYQDLVMSPFMVFENGVVDGVDYDSTETNVYEVSFYINGEKSIVFDLTMGHIDNENEVKKFSFFK